MATNKPDARKTHITRIFGTNRDGDILDDVWADVERMDLVKGALQVPSNNPATAMQWQGLQRKFRWNDDPNGDDYSPEGTPSRKLETVKVCNVEAEADVNDPEEWIPIKSIRSLRARVETGTEANGGTAMDRFLSSVTEQQLTTARVVEVRRIVHCDTNIDAAAQAAADAGQKEYVVSSDDYDKDLGTKDEDQYAEHEIIRYLKHKGNAGDVSGIGRQTKLLNDYLIDESEPAKQDITGSGGVNPPYRLDPFQNIVNINFSRNVIVVFVDSNGTVHIPSKFNPLPSNRKLDLLEQFPVTAPTPDGPQRVGTATAFKVNASAGAFVQVVTPAFSTGPVYPETALTCFVFAMDGNNPNDSLTRAKAGTALALASALFLGGGVPQDASPPGLLWSVKMVFLPAGLTMNWKIRTGNHRPNNSPSVNPNRMVQCYALGPSYTATFEGFDPPAQTYGGYILLAYRLDKKGTGTAYGTRPENYPEPQGVDPQWRQVLSGLNGIPFTDPPPLITADIV